MGKVLFFDDFIKQHKDDEDKLKKLQLQKLKTHDEKKVVESKEEEKKLPKLQPGDYVKDKYGNTYEVIKTTKDFKEADEIDDWDQISKFKDNPDATFVIVWAKKTKQKKLVFVYGVDDEDDIYSVKKADNNKKEDFYTKTFRKGCEEVDEKQLEAFKRKWRKFIDAVRDGSIKDKKEEKLVLNQILSDFGILEIIKKEEKEKDKKIEESVQSGIYIVEADESSDSKEEKPEKKEEPKKEEPKKEEKPKEEKKEKEEKSKEEPKEDSKKEEKDDKDADKKDDKEESSKDEADKEDKNEEGDSEEPESDDSKGDEEGTPEDEVSRYESRARLNATDLTPVDAGHTENNNPKEKGESGSEPQKNGASDVKKEAPKEEKKEKKKVFYGKEDKIVVGTEVAKDVYEVNYGNKTYYVKPKEDDEEVFAYIDKECTQKAIGKYSILKFKIKTLFNVEKYKESFSTPREPGVWNDEKEAKERAKENIADMEAEKEAEKDKDKE